MNPTTPDRPTHEAAENFDAARMVVLLLLASLTMGFGALLAFYFIMRAQAETWPPPGTPRLPAALWLSTGALLLSSVTIHRALSRVRHGAVAEAPGWLVGTLVLALVFLVSQLVNWGLAVLAEMPPGMNMYATTFYLLTGLHGIHVIGGLVPLVVVTVKAFRRRYTPARYGGLSLCVLYWHFVDVVWLIMFAALLLGEK